MSISANVRTLLNSPFRWLAATGSSGVLALFLPVVLLAFGINEAGLLLGYLLWFVITPACGILFVLDLVRLIRGDF